MSKNDIKILRHQIRRAKKSLREKFRRKKFLKQKHLRFAGVSHVRRRETLINEERRKQLKSRYRNYTHVVAPTTLSMADNPEETISFINRLEELFEKREMVFVHLEKVKHLAHGAIVVLLSIMMKFKAQGIKFNGDKPRAEEPFYILESSGFFKHLYDKYPDISEDKDLAIKGDRIFTHANKIVNQELSDSIIYEISQMIWGTPRRCTKMQRVFIELMQNTNNHAAIEEKGVHHWWTTACYLPKERKACFAFIDYGVGILKSLKSGKRGIFANFFSEIMNVFRPQNDAELLNLLLNGDLHKLAKLKKANTSTKKYYRGKGLPGIYKAFKNNHISNLVIITNNVMAQCTNDTCLLLNSDFHGTFVYWELNEQNNNLPYE